MSQAARISALLSIDDYLVLEQTSAIRHELVDGRLYAMVGATDVHNLLVQGFAAALRKRLKGSGCRIFTETIKLRVGDNFRYPDVFVTCAASDNDPLFKTQSILIAEILSDTSRRRDQEEKRDEYRQIASLRYYVLLEQGNVSARCWSRQDDGWGSVPKVLLTGLTKIPFS
ncbi:MAG: Uma2 family endonuclease [Candidatus Competibacteraceae bacterium]